MKSFTFSDGYKTFVNVAGANQAAYMGGQYVADVERAIDDLKGRAAEYWHEGAFYINAAVKGNPARVIKVPEQGRESLGAPDLEGSWGDEYGLKYYKNAEESAKQQAKTVWERYNEYLAECKRTSREPISYDDYVKNLKNPDRNAPLYEGQYRLIPSDQLEEAKEWLKRKIHEESAVRPEQAARYKDALDMLTDRISNGEGIESIPLTEAEAKEIAKTLREGGFDPAKFGLTTEDLIKWENIMEQAFAAGLSAAVISVVLEVAPELINIFKAWGNWG